MMPSMKPVNTYWAIPGALLAGEYPGDKDPAIARRKLDALLDCGVRAFLDLTHPPELRPYETILDGVAAARGIDCVRRRMPIVDMNVPEHPGAMRETLAQIAAWRSEGRIVYVHCWGGVGRTGTVIGCALVEGGLNGEQALARLGALWQQMSEPKRREYPVSPQTHEQREYVRVWRPATASHPA